MHVQVGGDGSFLALVDTCRSESFVGGDWSEDDRLHKHLAAQSGMGRIPAWGVGFESDWIVDIQAGHSTERFREFVADIINTGDALHRVNHDSLTMAAQFDDHLLPDEETADDAVPMPPGAYRVRVLKMFDPTSNGWDVLGDASPAFRIGTRSSTQAPPRGRPALVGRAVTQGSGSRCPTAWKRQAAARKVDADIARKRPCTEVEIWGVSLLSGPFPIPFHNRKSPRLRGLHLVLLTPSRRSAIQATYSASTAVSASVSSARSVSAM
jgi:hypothetical protein